MAEFTTSELYAIRVFLKEALEYEEEQLDCVEGEEREDLLDSLYVCDDLIAKITTLIRERTE